MDYNVDNDDSDFRPHIALIDDGINTCRFSLDLEYDLEFNPKSLTMEPRVHQETRYLSHGTLCAGIVKKFYPNCILSSLKVLSGTTPKGQCAALLSALEWCFHKPIDIINISAGSTNFQDLLALRNIANRLTSYRKIIIVAAISNEQIFTYPASFSSVIGVKGLPDDHSGLYSNDLSFDGTDIFATDNHLLIDSESVEVEPGRGNSFAAPYVTAQICHALKRPTHSVTAFKKQFLNRFTWSLPRPYLRYIKPDWIVTAVCYSSTPIIPELCFFELAALVVTHDGMPRANWQNSSYILTADTIIFAWDKRVPDNEKAKVLNQALEMGKNLVLLDDPLPDFMQSQTTALESNIWCLSDWAPEQLQAIPPSSEPLSVPIIAIYDFNTDRLVRSGYSLVNNFAGEGYHPFICSDSPLAVLYDQYYVPLSSLSGAGYFHSIVSAINPDLIICCCSLFENGSFLGKQFLDSLPADVAIFFDESEINQNPDIHHIYIMAPEGNHNCPNNTFIHPDQYTGETLYGLIKHLLG